MKTNIFSRTLALVISLTLLFFVATIPAFAEHSADEVEVSHLTTVNDEHEDDDAEETMHTHGADEERVQNMQKLISLLTQLLELLKTQAALQTNVEHDDHE
jgi:hypothetical protein